jgi:hypothetical protein
MRVSWGTLDRGTIPPHLGRKELKTQSLPKIHNDPKNKDPSRVSFLVGLIGDRAQRQQVLMSSTYCKLFFYIVNALGAIPGAIIEIEIVYDNTE